MSKENEIRKYLEQKVDPFLKPLLLDLMKNKPADVYPYLRNWIDGKGNDINNNLNAKQETEKSVHYEVLKKSVIEPPKDPVIEEEQKGEEAPVEPQEEVIDSGNAEVQPQEEVAVQAQPEEPVAEEQGQEQVQEAQPENTEEKPAEVAPENAENKEEPVQEAPAE